MPRPRSQALEIPQASPPPAVTTKAFWPLMDRWGIPDDKALELLGRRRGLTRSGGRPRFTLDAEEVRRLDYMIMRGTPGLAEVNRFLARWSFSQALRTDP